MQTRCTTWFAFAALESLAKTCYMSRRQDSSNFCKHSANWRTISVTKALISWLRAAGTPKASLKGQTQSTLKWRRKRTSRLKLAREEERSALMSTIFVATQKIKMTRMPAWGKVASALAETAHVTTPKSILLPFRTSLSLSARRKRAWRASWTLNWSDSVSLTSSSNSKFGESETDSEPSSRNSSNATTTNYQRWWSTSMALLTASWLATAASSTMTFKTMSARVTRMRRQWTASWLSYQKWLRTLRQMTSTAWSSKKSQPMLRSVTCTLNSCPWSSTSASWTCTSLPSRLYLKWSCARITPESNSNCSLSCCWVSSNSTWTRGWRKRRWM